MSDDLIERCVQATYEQFGKERGTMPDPYAAAEICIRLTREHDAALTRSSSSSEMVEAVAPALEAYFAERTGFGTSEGEGRISAYYGGNWITLDTNEIAQAAVDALSKTISAGGRD